MFYKVSSQAETKNKNKKNTLAGWLAGDLNKILSKSVPREVEGRP